LSHLPQLIVRQGPFQTAAIRQIVNPLDKGFAQEFRASTERPWVPDAPDALGVNVAGVVSKRIGYRSQGAA
jgi:hypothetical protein